MRAYRNGKYYGVSCLAMISITLLCVSMTSKNWLYSVLKRRSNNEEFFAGNKTFGLFRGCQYKRYGQFVNYRIRCFNVFTELKAIDSSTPAYITVSCMCGSLGCLLIVTYVGIYIETVKSLVESLVINLLLILNTSALLFDFVALTSYSYLYHTKLKKTTLQKEEILGGFSSKTELEQSFWLCSSSPIFIVLNMIYILVLCRTQANRTTRRDVSNSSTSWKKGDNMRSPMIY
ncbi:uncharacterized protein LOC130644661 isoform X1 [Hydractinia symbiolongicarpus]|uniref:uncharacterized protein LOC130644661 isoform X1 n=1 Tax=Hydractinia symbiolongicarpus TaxID=13093 RepID=UPI00254A7067|nr:uncharacterized protein LOC130644661 isoform X1 [Hydractinia symbiolongicarpus]